MMRLSSREKLIQVNLVHAWHRSKTLRSRSDWIADLRRGQRQPLQLQRFKGPGDRSAISGCQDLSALPAGGSLTSAPIKNSLLVAVLVSPASFRTERRNEKARHRFLAPDTHCVAMLAPRRLRRGWRRWRRERCPRDPKPRRGVPLRLCHRMMKRGPFPARSVNHVSRGAFPASQWTGGGKVCCLGIHGPPVNRAGIEGSPVERGQCLLERRAVRRDFNTRPGQVGSLVRVGSS